MGKAGVLRGISPSSCLACRYGVHDHVESAFSRSNAHLPFGTANRVQCAMVAQPSASEPLWGMVRTMKDV